MLLCTSRWQASVEIRAAICQNAADPAAAMHVAMGFVVIAVTALALAPWRGANRWMVLLAGLPGYLLLADVANDYARWTLFSCMALWLFAISAPRAVLASLDRKVALADVACLAAGCVLLMALVPATGAGISRVVAPVPRVDQWPYRSSGPKPLGFAEVVAVILTGAMSRARDRGRIQLSLPLQWYQPRRST